MQVLANFLSTPLASGLGGDLSGWPYIAFDIDPGVVKVSENLPPFAMCLDSCNHFYSVTSPGLLALKLFKTGHS